MSVNWDLIRKVTVAFVDGPLDGVSHSWVTDMTEPPYRIPNEWGTYVYRGLDWERRWVYQWEEIR